MNESVSLWRCHHLDPTVVDLNDSRKILAPRASVPGVWVEHLDSFSEGVGFNPIPLAMLSGDVV
jgi:hypothetical protein